MSILFITHDLKLVQQIADVVVVMRNGEAREQGTVDQVFQAPADPYTRALLACRPQLARRPAKLPVIDDFLGDVPPPTAQLPERRRGLTGDEPVVLEARHLAKSFFRKSGLFRSHEAPAVRDASFRLARGKTLGIVGESGSGKTTLALMLVRLHQPTRGEVLFEGRDLSTLPAAEALTYKRRIQIVFQNPYASLNPRFTVGQILMEPMQIHAIGADAAERRELAYAMLHKVGLTAQSFFKYPHEFSGGQRQRIAIARCLTLKPDVLICDEAVSALDVSIQAQLLNLLQDLQDELGMSYLFISHDLTVVKYMSDEVMVMNQGEVVEIADSDEIYARPQHPYTRQLLASMP
jgi:peptide/nickel transport system ATP-binding protein